MDRIYADHNATCPLSSVARAALLGVLDLGPLNPGAVHGEGQRASRVLEGARRQIRDALGLGGGVVVFTSGATEANALAFSARPPRSGRVWVSPLEHASVREAVRGWEAQGLSVHRMGHDPRGRVDLAFLEEVREGDLVVLMAANNELGNLNPIDALGFACAARGAALHVDAAQLAGRLPWRVPEGVTSVALSAHKAGGPVGIGGLWLAAPQPVIPLWPGGSQERGWRPGTEDVAKASAMAAVYAAPEAWSELVPLRDAIERGLVERVGAVVLGDVDHRLPHTSSIALPGRRAEEVVQALDLEGVAISAGAACSAGSLDPSPVIEALGVAPEVAQGAVRLSWGPGQGSRVSVEDIVSRFERALRHL